MEISKFWTESWRADPRARRIIDNHYSRQNPNSKQFVPPGQCILLISVDCKAVWISSNPKREYVKHAWAGAWINSAFRNESANLSSEMITEALAVTRYFWPEIPELGMITFIDRSQVKPKKHFGQCYRFAGFSPANCPVHIEKVRECLSCKSKTKANQLTLQLLPKLMPEPMKPYTDQVSLFDIMETV